MRVERVELPMPAEQAPWIALTVDHVHPNQPRKTVALKISSSASPSSPTGRSPQAMA